MLIDSHCHLDGPEFDGDREAAIARARAAGVEELVCIGGGTSEDTLECGVRIARAHLGVWSTVGIHPHEARHASEGLFRRLADLAGDRRVIAIGEIGLDYHYDHSAPDVQRRVFARQLELAQQLDFPVSIHCREAWDDCFAAIQLANSDGPGLRGVFHCFTGGLPEARRALEYGFYLSFSGILTFPKAEEIRAAAQHVPESHLLIETDAPYLAPVPHRGRRNEPAYVVQVAARLAEIRGWSNEEAAARTTANFHHLFPRTNIQVG